MKSFGEGKDLNYELQVESFPEINLKSLENFKAIQVTDLNNLSANKVFERLLNLL